MAVFFVWRFHPKHSLRLKYYKEFQIDSSFCEYGKKWNCRWAGRHEEESWFQNSAVRTRNLCAGAFKYCLDNPFSFPDLRFIIPSLCLLGHGLSEMVLPEKFNQDSFKHSILSEFFIERSKFSISVRILFLHLTRVFSIYFDFSNVLVEILEIDPLLSNQNESQISFFICLFYNILKF